MSSPSLPVPSKAALHALRGIALGASCAIGAILEDRRRRISTLSTAVRNKKKLQASRRYHGAAEAVRAPDDDSFDLLNEEVYRLRRPRVDESTRLGVPGDVSWAEGTPLESERAQDIASSKRAPADSKPSVPHDKPRNPLPEHTRSTNILNQQTHAQLSLARDSQGWVRSRTSNTSAKHVDRLFASASELDRMDQTVLEAYITKFLRARRNGLIERQREAEWLEISARLCKLCQAKGMLHNAQQVLLAVVKHNTLDEEAYYNHGPLWIVESTIDVATGLGSPERRQSLTLAVALLTPTFTEPPQTHAKEMEQLAKKLLPLLLEHRKLLVDSVLSRWLALLNDSTDMAVWATKLLFEHRSYRSLLRLFKLAAPKMKPDQRCFRQIMEMVITAIEFHKGSHTTTTLVTGANCHNFKDLRWDTAWLTRLLQCFWARFKDSTRSQELVNLIESLGYLDKIPHPDLVYKILMEHYVRDGNDAMVAVTWTKITEKWPHKDQAVDLTRFLALSKALKGDWDGVMEDFHRLKPHRLEDQSEYNHAFISVLKPYANTHDIADMERVVKFFISEMGVTVNRELVTLVADQYGRRREARGFLKWLKYCGSKGFVLDSAFTNAVLHNCQMHWKFSFPDLTRLARFLKSEGLALTDDERQLLHKAALIDGTEVGKPDFGPGAVRRLKTLEDLASTDPPQQVRIPTENELLVRMHKALATNRPALAISAYDQAKRANMAFSPYCFRTLIRAYLTDPRGPREAKVIAVIRETHQQGHNVSSATVSCIKVLVEQYRGTYEQVMARTRNLVEQFELGGIPVNPQVLLHTAIVCSKFGRHDNALRLCNLAMEKHRTVNPCYSKLSLRAYLMVYWQTLNVEGIAWLVESLPKSRISQDRTSTRLLKETSRHLRRTKDGDSRTVKILQLLDIAKEGTKAARSQRMSEAPIVNDEIMRIVEDAVARHNAATTNEALPRASEVTWGASQTLETVNDEGAIHSFFEKASNVVASANSGSNEVSLTSSADHTWRPGPPQEEMLQPGTSSTASFEGISKVPAVSGSSSFRTEQEAKDGKELERTRSGDPSSTDPRTRKEDRGSFRVDRTASKYFNKNQPVEKAADLLGILPRVKPKTLSNRHESPRMDRTTLSFFDEGFSADKAGDVGPSSQRRGTSKAETRKHDKSRLECTTDNYFDSG